MHVAPPAAPPHAARWPRLVGAASTARAAAAAALTAALAAMRGAQKAKHAVVEKTHEMGDAAAQVAAVPADVAAEVRKQLDAWWRGTSRSLALGAVVAVLGIFALVFTSVAAARLLDRTIGAPWGTLAVGAFYLVAALALLARIRREKQDARDEVAEHREHARAIASGRPETLKSGPTQ